MIRNFSTRNLRSQRGAMFGLDARIALAIFAGLSVIAGMAVFGTIRQTDVTAAVTEFDNLSKGYINFAFDTGIDAPNFSDLYEDAGGTLGWKGPYLTRSTDQHPKFGVYSLVDASIDATWSATPVSTGSVEGAWVKLTDVPCEIAEDLDKAVDGDDDPAVDGIQMTPDDGNFRQGTCTAGEMDVHYLLSRKMG